MKAFYHAPLVGCTLPSSQRPQRLFLSSRPYYHYSHQYHLVASKDNYMYNKKHNSLMVTLSSFSGMSSEKFPEAGWEWDACSSSSESIKNLEDVVVDDYFTWNPNFDPTSGMDARFIESIVFDRRLYKYEILDRKTRAAEIMKQQVLNSAGDKDEIGCALDTIEQDIVQGKFEWRDGQDVHTNIMEALENLVGEQAKELPTTNKSDRCLFVVNRWCKDCIEHITTRIKRIQMALVLLAIRNKGLVLSGISKPEDNTLLDDIIFPIVKKDAIFYLFSGVENVLEMLDLCTKFAEGISFNQEKVHISPPGGFSDAISFVRFLKSKELSLETSYYLVGVCLRRQCQPGELTLKELQSIGVPCDSLRDIDRARSLLLGKPIVFSSSTNQNSVANLLSWCRKLEIDPQIFC